MTPFGGLWACFEQLPPMGLTQGDYGNPFSQVFPDSQRMLGALLLLSVARSRVEADPLVVLESRPDVHCAHTKLSFKATVFFFFSEHFKWNKYTAISMEWQSAISSLFIPAGDPDVPGAM